ncbi:RNA-binding protein 42 [Boleophthalmus pectinirostris]|uniref:RNA-binding protein 42 n=1 Tax=Boleophthalmus pectinirostris TaxID=150288 RepID=UPI00243002C1|nr:RNA-binding protein 42 [Boleophthalmus pectinirostris]
MAGKMGEDRLKEMEAEMALFEQEVLGGPVAGGPSVMEAVPMALAVPMVRPIIGTNTYQQVQQTLEARAASFVGPPGPTFVAPVRAPPPMMRPAFVPHILQRPGTRLPMVGDMMTPMGDPSGSPAATSSTPVIQAAPTVYSAPPATIVRKPERTQRQARMEELAARVAEQQAAVMAAGLLNKKEPEESPSTVRASRPEPEPPHIEVESVSEDKKKSKGDKMKKCIRTAAGTSWEDASLLEWDSDDFRIFCGDLGNEVNDDILARAFSRYPSFLKAKVVRDKRTGKTKGYGFVSFKDPNDYVRAMREMNGKYVGSRPIKLRKSMWKDRNIEVVRKKQKEKKKLGLR